MKYIFKILLFFSLTSFAQNAFFIDTHGKKTFMRDDSVEIIVEDKRISYAEVNKEWEKYLRFKDLDYAIVGPYYFKSFDLIDKKGRKESRTAYFVVTESKSKKLLVYHYTVISKYSSTDYFSVCIINDNNQILDRLSFTNKVYHKEIRVNIKPMIEKHFADCPNLMEAFKVYAGNDEYYTNILGFFRKPFYNKCD